MEGLTRLNSSVSLTSPLSQIMGVSADFPSDLKIIMSRVGRTFTPPILKSLSNRPPLDPLPFAVN